MKDKLDQQILTICDAIIQSGGRPFIVGGWVRDLLLGIGCKDVDIEVFQVSLDQLQEVLMTYGEVDLVGKSFGVLRVHGLDVDFSIPRADNKVGEGHRGFKVECDPAMTFHEASKRRDLTINSMGWCLTKDTLCDPHNGRRDLEEGVLRSTDPETFVEDPLRGLRVAQFAARFGFHVSPETLGICSQLDLSELPGERLMAEFEKLLLKGKAGSIGKKGLEFLRETRLLRHFPELEVLVDSPQDPVWHPEGSVWTHTCMVVDEAANLRTGDREHDLVLMFGALCHDLGKPSTTTFEVEGQETSEAHFREALAQWCRLPEEVKMVSIEQGTRPRIRSCSHEVAGAGPARRFLSQLMASHELIEAVVGLTMDHLAPHTFMSNKAGPGAFRRLARRLGDAGTNLQMLHKVATADHFGRNTPEALAREYPAGDWFIERAGNLQIKVESPPDVVMGRHLIAMGWTPDPEFGLFLDKCRDVQYDTGWNDPDRIIRRVLKGGGAGIE